MRRGRGQRIQEVALSPRLLDQRKIFTRDNEAAFGTYGKTVLKSDRPYKSKFIDAFDFFGAYRGVREKHTRITFDVLRRMSKTCEPVAAILNLRCNQAAAFAKVPRFETDTGFKITTRDPETKVGPAEKKEIQRLQNFYLSTGFAPNPERKDNLDLFLRKIVRDSLTLDAYAIEIVPGKNPRKYPVAEVWAVDGATIRFAQEDRYDPYIYMEDAGEIAFVQEIDGRILAEYTREELAYGIRNPSTEVLSNGYGMSELESAINLISSILLAAQYNRSYFSNNSTPRGIINLVGNYSPEDLEAFKRSWRAQLEGAANSWRTPMMATDNGTGINFIPLDNKGNRDMEYHLWLDWLTNTLCSLYGVNPEELGLQGYNPKGQALSEASPEAAIEKGEDKGLAPLMTNLANTLNSNVTWRVNEDMSLEWTGLQNDDRDAKQKYFTGYLKAGVFTVNEVRAQNDLPEIKAEWADEAPADPILYQAYAADKQAKLAAQQPQGAPGMPAGPGPQMPPNNLLNQPPKPGDKPDGEARPPSPPKEGPAVPPGRTAGPAPSGIGAGGMVGPAQGALAKSLIGGDEELTIIFEQS